MGSQRLFRVKLIDREVAHVIEAGNGQISIPDAWRPGTPHSLPPLMTAEHADTLLSHLFADAGPPRALLAPGVV